MDRNVVESIRQQADDLRDELKDLEQWEESTIQREESNKSRKGGAPKPDDTTEPPIRGTVPSLKDAVAASAQKEGKKTSSDETQIQQAKERGNELFRQGKIADAIQAYTTGINIAPSSAATHVLYGNRAMCYLKEMNWDKAEKDATACLQLDRGYAKAYYRRALARKNLGNLKEARSDVEAVLALVPGDESAKAELEIITKMLQVQRAKESSGPAVKKKIVIEEVEDDDDEDDENGENNGTGGGAAQGDDVSVGASSLSPEEEKQREARIQQHMAEVDRARRAQEEAARATAQRAEREQAQRQRATAGHSRVEIIEEDEDAKEEATAKAEAPKKATTTSTSPPAPVEEVKSAPAAARHSDPIVSDDVSPARAKPTPKPAASPPTQLRSANVTKESLAAPKTFTEFERTFNSIKDNQELVNYYISLMNPAGLSTLFRSNMSPAMLSSIVSAIAQFPGSTAFQFLKGLSKVSRVDELTLFFSEAEKKQLMDALNLAKASGADVKEVDTLKKKLMPF